MVQKGRGVDLGFQFRPAAQGWASSEFHIQSPTFPELRGWVSGLASSLAVELIVSPAPTVPFLFEKGCEKVGSTHHCRAVPSGVEGGSCLTVHARGEAQSSH